VTITWKRTANVLLVAMLAVLVCGRLAGMARADVFGVSTPQELQSAITDAAGTAGDDTINLAAGTYDIGSTIGTVNLRANDPGDGSTNGITLAGAGASTTILDGDGVSGPVVDVSGSVPMAIRGVTIRGSSGDGIDAFQGNPVALSDDVVRDNAAFGISGASLQITATTISGNGTTGLDVECGVNATNDTVANNTGVGVHIDCTNPGDALKHLTVAGNGGAGISFTESIELDNSIVAGNAGGDCDISGMPTGKNDLIDSGTCGTSLTGVVTGDPRLGPLQDNGGPTPTMAIAAGSPAIDAANDGICPTTDQRGTPRPQGPHCDIGAFELQSTNHPPACSAYTGFATTGGTLHDALSCTDPDVGDHITLAAPAGPTNGTLVLSPDGTFSYTPAAGFNGTDSFTFQATDSQGNTSNVATATIRVGNTPVGANVTVAPASGLTLTFAAVTAGGETSATSSTTGPPAAGFQVPGGSLYWDITTTATYTAPILVCLPVPAGVTTAHLIHFDNGQPVDVLPTEILNGDVCGDVNSLSPFVVAVPAATSTTSTLSYTGPTSTTFGPVTLSARLTDASTHAGLAGRAVGFSVDATAPISGTTAADGSVSVTTALPIPPGVHSVTVSFAGDGTTSASQTTTSLTVTNSAQGSVVAIVPRLTSGGALELLAHVGTAGKLIGELVSDGPHRLYIATAITALGIGADGHSAWIAGKDATGHTFLANAVDAAGHGDNVRLWIDGTLVDGDGSIRLGGVEVDARH
jgi:hypothetical protein